MGIYSCCRTLFIISLGLTTITGIFISCLMLAMRIELSTYQPYTCQSVDNYNINWYSGQCYHGTVFTTINTDTDTTTISDQEFISAYLTLPPVKLWKLAYPCYTYSDVREWISYLQTHNYTCYLDPDDHSGFANTSYSDYQFWVTILMISIVILPIVIMALVYKWHKVCPQTYNYSPDKTRQSETHESHDNDNNHRTDENQNQGDNIIIDYPTDLPIHTGQSNPQQYRYIIYDGDIEASDSFPQPDIIDVTEV